MKTRADRALHRFGWQLHLAGLGFVAGAVGLAYAFVFAPLARSATDCVAEVQSLEERLLEAPRVRAERARLSAELSESERRAAQILARVPPEAQEADFLAMATQLASESGLRIEDYRPGAPQRRTAHSEMEIGLTCRGTYEALCRFLDGLGRLPRLANLARLEIKPLDSTSECTATMTLVIYFAAQVDSKTARTEVPHA